MMFSKGDQVVVKETVSRPGPRVTRSVKVGTVLAASDDAVTVSMPLPGGRSVKKVYPVADCSPVTEVFARNSVHVNPAFRQIYRGSV